MVLGYVAVVAAAATLQVQAAGTPHARVSSALSVDVKVLKGAAGPEIQLTLTNVSKRYRIVEYASGDVALHCKTSNPQVHAVFTGARRNIFVAVVLAPGDRHSLPPFRISFAEGVTGAVTTRIGFQCGEGKFTQGELRAWHDKGGRLPGFNPKQWGGGSTVYWSKPVRLRAP